MRHPLHGTVLVFLASLTLVADAPGQRRSAAAELSQFQYRTVEFPAPSIGGDGSYGIYLPKGYDDAAQARRSYPWAIWLHGMRGHASRFRTGGAAVFDKLRRDGKIPAMILVTPSASSRPTYIDRGRGRNEESLILKDLVAHVEKHFRVSRQRHQRAIMGVSMGAFGAMKMALKHPQMFGTVAVHSSPVLTADPDDLGRYRRFAAQVFGDPIDKKEWAKEIPIALLETLDARRLAGLRIYFDAGTADRYGFGPGNVELSKRMKKAEIAHTFQYIEGGGHSWSTNAIQHAMQFSFPFVAAGFAAAPKPAPARPGDPAPKPKAGK